MRQTRSQTKASLPPDFLELQKSIDSFSTAELYELLSPRSHSGLSKKQLRAKCTELLTNQYSKIKAKIADILTKRQTRNINPVAAAVANQALAFQEVYQQIFLAAQAQQQQQQQHQQQQQRQRTNSAQTAVVQPRQANTNGHLMYQQQGLGLVPNSGNGNVSHTNGLLPSYAQSVPSNLPVNPDVKLKKLAFFDVLAILLKPSTLIPTVTSTRQQEGTYYFHLTPQQATDIASNRDIRNAQKVEHVIQVQLRFCMLETSCEQEDYFPPNVVVKVNNKMCPLPNPIPTNKPGVEPKRPPRPVNITTNVKLSPTVANNISVQWCTDFNRGFVISAYLVKKLTSSQLLHRMKSKGIKPADYTRALIKEKLNEDADCEIATTMLRVSLMCPLGKMRMTTPCRAATCSHLQCFDASLYLQMNERKPTWNCPVCDKPAVYDTLVIDGYFEEVLSSSRLPSGINEIQLLKDGSWSTHEPQSESQSLDTPMKAAPKVEVISDDVVIISDDSPNNSIRNPLELNNGDGNSAKNEPTSTTMGESVDLTLSDSDDDLPAARKPTSSSSSVQSSLANKIAAAPSAMNNDSIISLDSPSPPSSPINMHRQSNNDGPHLNAISTSVINTMGATAEFVLPTEANADLSPAERFDPITEYQKWISAHMANQNWNNITRSFSSESGDQQNRYNFE